MKTPALMRIILVAATALLLAMLPAHSQAAGYPITMQRATFATLNVPYHAPTLGAETARAAQPGRMRQLDLRVEIVKPVRAKNAPVIYVVHGGGWWGGSTKKMRPFTYPLAKAGYVTVSVEYRLSCKRAGNPYVENIQQVRPPYFPNVTPGEGAFCGHDMAAMIEDVERGYGWTLRNVRRYGGDPERVSVLGASAGAHLATMLADNDPQSLLLFSVPANFAAQARANSNVVPALGNTIGCAFDVCPDKWRAFSSPTVFGEHRPAPTFFAGGVYETVTPLSDALRYGRAIKRAGGYTRFVYAKSSCHGTGCLYYPTARGTDLMAETLNFLARYG